MEKSFKDTIKNYELINQFYYFFMQVINKYLINDIQAIRFMFQLRLGRKLDLNNPTKFNDKLQWLKLNWYDPDAKICADKYTVRAIVEKEIGSEYLNELYATYDNVHQIHLS